MLCGHAYEYICTNELEKYLSKYVDVKIEKTSTYAVGMEAWDILDKRTQETLRESARAILESFTELEPNLIDAKENDTLIINIQSDLEGISGDVRDIVISKKKTNWEIGISLKHNHFAVKHSRLSGSIDFCERWFGGNCSKEYFDKIQPIFDMLEEEKENGKKWSEIKNKADAVYVPILEAFLDEIKRSYAKDKDMPKKMVEYLLGKYDFYKVISLDSKRITRIQPFNIRGDLNKPSERFKPKIIVPQTHLPTRLISAEMKPGSTNTVEMFLDNGWQFSFRIHSAATLVETSLKFDIQLMGMPTSIMTINCMWK